MPRVFISYSHDSEEHKDWVLNLSERLRNEGLDCRIDQHINGFPPEGWTSWMEDQIEQADFVLMVCTANYLNRFKRKDAAGGRGVAFEGIVITQTLYDAYFHNTKFIPVIPETGSFDHVPLALKQYGPFRLPQDYDALYRFLTQQPQVIAPPLGPIVKMPLRSSNEAKNIYTNRLPTTRGEFFGRNQELKLLDDAYAGDAINMVQFIAPGGTGKTKLLQHWLDQHRDIKNLIAWSFYSQGSSEDKQVSATPFFEHAFEKLAASKRQFSSEEDKGEYLADLLIQKACVLILDGLEPLQHASKGMRGELKDRAMRALLKNLANRRCKDSFCVITTRLTLPEIENRQPVISYDLQNLSLEDGVQLLKSLKVHGLEAQLQLAVQEYGCHALALSLLGNALATFWKGDVRKRDRLGDLIDMEGDASSRHAFKVMQAYAEWLKDSNELKLLLILGLFDHPVEIEVIEMLWKTDIPGLTAPSGHFIKRLFKKWTSSTKTSKDWRPAIKSLRDDFHLLFEHPGQADLLDCHPLIREYFGKLLKQNASVWQKAQQTLYEYYKALPKKQLPETLAQMQPLFTAIAHGCAAGLHQQALDEVYWPLIRRKKENYLCKKLGAFNDDLAVLAHFFSQPWQKPAEHLNVSDQALVLSWAGFRLRALGRLIEAVQPMQAGFEMAVQQKDWKGAADDAGNLSELHVTLGNPAEAKHYALSSVEHADASEDWSKRMVNRTTLADVLLQSGDLKQALQLFQEAEQIQIEFPPEYKMLYALQGFRYCDLLLEQGDIEAVLMRAEQALVIAKQNNWLLAIALDQLSLAKAHILSMSGYAKAKPTYQEHAQKAGAYVEQAVTDLRAAGTQEFIPLALIVRATFFRHTQAFNKAHKDLDEVKELAETCRMRLHLCDYHLESARLALAEKETEKARHHRQQAARLIEETGYKRRLPELNALPS